MACKCYHAERNFVGKIGVCWGTKECEACSCGGDESKCDFYEDKRKKATPKTTNYDRLISKTPEELAVWFCQCMLDCCGCPAFGKCMKYDGDANERSKTAPGLVDWLKSPVEVEE